MQSRHPPSGLSVIKRFQPPQWLADRSLRDYNAESTLFTRQAVVTLFIVGLGTFLLFYRLYQLQICQHQRYQTRSKGNCIKLLPTAASRGLIYDRNGVLLAGNLIDYQLVLHLDRTVAIDSLLQQLAPIAELTVAEITQFKKNYPRHCRLMPMVLKKNLSEKQMARFAIHQHRFPSVEINGHQRRHYPYGAALSHVLGYLAKINDQEQQHLRSTGQNHLYTVTPEIGKLGIERYYELLLRGKPGYESVEINRRGQIVRRLSQQPSQAGANLTLTIDINLQCHIEKLMRGQRGAVVAVDPRDGSVLALVSSPSYDPNQFVSGMTPDTYQQLLDNPDRPLINRATQGVYPPASTVKPFISIAALAEGVVTQESRHFDPGWWQLPGSQKRYWNCKRQRYGMINLTRSLEASSDTFFYQVAYDLGIDRLAEWMRLFGYGKPSGIDLGEELAGLMPTREWKMQRYQQPWYQGDTIPVGIGQGYWTATPMQMTKALVTLVNNGETKRPHLLYQQSAEKPCSSAPEAIQLHNPNFWKLAKEGMYGGAHRPHGTARRAFMNAPYKVGIKSGTAQLFNLKDEFYRPEKLAKQLHDHAQLIAFAPYHQPTIALTIILENAGSGSRWAAPLARQIFDYVLGPCKPPSPLLAARKARTHSQNL
ncbi:MAG: penicillin-binding protein 2 [Candidatus Symbiodolus clandestinus]